MKIAKCHDCGGVLIHEARLVADRWRCANCGKVKFTPPERKGCRPCAVEDWRDVGFDSRGWIKTVCSKCKNFIGFRPPPKPPAAKKRKRKEAATA